MMRDDIPPLGDEIGRLRMPPHSVQAEQSLLGGLLLDNGAFDRVSDLVREADFYRQEHRVIWAAVESLVLASKTADVITVFDRLGDKRNDVGGLEYLNALAQSVPSAAAARRYAEIVREKAVLRQAIAKADEVATAAFRANAEAADVLNLAASGFGAIERTTTKTVPVAIGTLVARRLEVAEDLEAGRIAPGGSTGIEELDDLLGGGLMPGIYVIGARPGMGKSTLAQQICEAYGERNEASLFLSQEMPASMLTDRALCRVGNVSFGRMRNGRLTDEEWGCLAAAADRLKVMPLHVDEQPALRSVDIRAKARAVPKVRLVVLDYVQLCSGEGDTRNQQLEGISRDLIALRKELDCPIIVLSQLNREVEKRANKRPIPADLRDCGGLEQDADVILFLYPVDEDKEKGCKVIGCAVDKNRSGPTGEKYLDFYGSTQRFYASDYKPVVKVGAVRGGGFE